MKWLEELQITISREIFLLINGTYNVIDNMLPLVKIICWCKTGNRPLSKPSSATTHIFVTVP